MCGGGPIEMGFIPMINVHAIMASRLKVNNSNGISAFMRNFELQGDLEQFVTHFLHLMHLLSPREILVPENVFQQYSLAITVFVSMICVVLHLMKKIECKKTNGSDGGSLVIWGQHWANSEILVNTISEERTTFKVCLKCMCSLLFFVVLCFFGLLNDIYV